MKKLILFLSIVFMTLGASSAFAQKYAYVDSKYILENMPEYAKAQTQLDALSASWQKEVERMYKEIDEMYKSYQNEQVLLTDEMKKKREEEITNREKAVKEYQKSKFGYEGELFKKREELVKPIQDRVYEAIQKMAQAKGYDFVFDKSVSGSPILYSNPALDKSNDILRDLGITPGSKKNNAGSGSAPAAGQKR
ncbi:MAG: OmpH family outer membrane protein [Chitinophagales bacterium]|nr:OmpH family outer membrane protein [Chitinophagales bacterium]